MPLQNIQALIMMFACEAQEVKVSVLFPIEIFVIEVDMVIMMDLTTYMCDSGLRALNTPDASIITCE